VLAAVVEGGSSSGGGRVGSVGFRRSSATGRLEARRYSSVRQTHAFPKRRTPARDSIARWGRLEGIDEAAGVASDPRPWCRGCFGLMSIRSLRGDDGAALAECKALIRTRTEFADALKGSGDLVAPPKASTSRSALVRRPVHHR